MRVLHAYTVQKILCPRKSQEKERTSGTQQEGGQSGKRMSTEDDSLSLSLSLNLSDPLSLLCLSTPQIYALTDTLPAYLPLSVRALLFSRVSIHDSWLPCFDFTILPCKRRLSHPWLALYGAVAKQPDTMILQKGMRDCCMNGSKTISEDSSQYGPRNTHV